MEASGRFVPEKPLLLYKWDGGELDVPVNRFIREPGHSFHECQVWVGTLASASRPIPMSMLYARALLSLVLPNENHVDESTLLEVVDTERAGCVLFRRMPAVGQSHTLI